ncbi:MAG: hypothetical protein IJW16_07535 [Clostridia bacterium]|nr:hypothetical protein [Clostridia bacterium]
MLYPKNKSKKLNRSLFQNPTSEYRGTPFWAWNDKLERDELIRQIGELKEMGFGGFHMHSRAGLAPTYLSEDFMDLISACNEEAKKQKMLAWLYDEDRWPSGAAGGYVTKDPKKRQKKIVMTRNQMENATDPVTGHNEGRPYLLAAYDVSLNEDGTLASYRTVKAEDEVLGTRYYAYVVSHAPTGWYNGQSYADTLDPETMQEFIRVTYETYKKKVGHDFGGSIPAIFTDEPQFRKMKTLPFANSDSDVEFAWTHTFPETFKAAYGIDIVEKLPEIVWDLPNGEPSRVRYLYQDHSCERFTEAFADQCGKWCEENGIALTGHMMEEPTLKSQSDMLGEAMRAYRGFGIPGIDMLVNRVELSTAKQCQSTVHQYGREAMLSELYGVTGWDFDFRGHKFQGDWQAALGVSVRVPHLSWVSMRGSAKRDYPASIHYQSAWYREYPYVEDHFARLNTVLTRGKPDVKVGVIHPIESYWLHNGPKGNNADVCRQLEFNFKNTIEWMLFGTVDFDFISESLLPDQHKAGKGAKLTVGEMKYDAIVLPGMETIRQSTLDILMAFQRRGGKVIVMGSLPTLIDAKKATLPKAFLNKIVSVPFSSTALLGALESERDVCIVESSGKSSENLIYNMRIDGKDKWLFIAHAKEPMTVEDYTIADYKPTDITITLRGEFDVEYYDTLTGKISPVCVKRANGKTVIDRRIYPSDSLLFRLAPVSNTAQTVCATDAQKRTPAAVIDCKEKVSIKRSEPNVYILDMAEWSLDGKEFEPTEEILRIDSKLRAEYGYPKADGKDVQPWCIPQEVIEHFPVLRFTVESEIEIACKLAYETAEEVILNGEQVEITRNGYFTDRHIYTMPLPKLKKGKNELVIRVPIGKRTSIENFFLLGEFGVRVEGSKATVTKAPSMIPFGDLTRYGFPFYGANVTYSIPVELEKDSDLVIKASHYRGALLRVSVDNRSSEPLVYAPYRVKVTGVKAGKHKINVTLFGSRINCFGTVHRCNNKTYQDPSQWYTKDEEFAYEYQLTPMGLMKSPMIEVYPIED